MVSGQWQFADGHVCIPSNQVVVRYVLQHIANKLLRPCVAELRTLEELDRKWKSLASEVYQEGIVPASGAYSTPHLNNSFPTPTLDDLVVMRP
jgi:hypothetical protein